MIRHLFKLVWYRKRSNALIMTEILLSFLVVFAVATFGLTAWTSYSDPLGFEWQDVWVLNLAIPDVDPNVEEAQNKAVVERLMREARAFPQVISVAASGTPAYSQATHSGRWELDGKVINLTRDEVTDGFGETMRVPLLRGRWFRPEDDALGFVPVVVDSDFAKALYGDEDPIGKKFDELENTEFRVVGVVPPYRKDGELSKRNMNMVFTRVSLTSPKGRAPRFILLRMKPGTSAEVEAQLTQRLHAIAPDVSFRLQRMDRMRDTVQKMRLSPIIVGGIVGGFLISMVALGLTGVLWQNVTRRTRELGLRRAFGATGPNVRRQILAEVALLATLSIVLGVAVVTQLPLLGLFQLVSPAMFIAGLASALAVIYAITLLCGLYPSWLASRLTPAEALRYE